MPRSLKTLLLYTLIPLCFVVGLYAGPHAGRLYNTWFPPPQFVEGDYAGLYASAGKPVVLYATGTCQYCAKVRALFAQRGVDYVEYRIDESKEHEEAFRRIGAPGVPVLFIGQRRIDGFRERVIIEALEEIGRDG